MGNGVPRRFRHEADKSPAQTFKPTPQPVEDWRIPYEELTIYQEIGNRYGSDQVIKGYWHGDVAIKTLNLPEEKLKNDKTVELIKEMFKEEVNMFCDTRHVNLVGFMGACIDLPRLAIVTAFCKGETLHDQIHINKDRFTLNKIILIAQQICEGMSYLHSRNIVHKDLKSKNIFFDNGQVLIKDFGLFSLKRLCGAHREGPWLPVPRDWLAHIPPEIMRVLNAHDGPELYGINFTVESDVYAFGTIWFELLVGDMPYRNQRPEITIWQVGRGLKYPLINLQAPREVKNILLMCWSNERPRFSELRQVLESIPRKRVQRSLSFNIDGSRI